MSNLNTTVTSSSRKHYRAVVLVVVLVTVVLNNLITTLSLKLRVRSARDSDHDAQLMSRHVSVVMVAAAAAPCQPEARCHESDAAHWQWH